MRKTPLWAICALLFTGAVAIGAEKAPEFTLKDLDGNRVRLSELLKNGPVLVDFWATWCKSCLQSFPALNKINETYREQGLQVIAISIDSPKSQSKVKPYIKSSDYSFRVLLDDDMTVRRMFGGTTAPYTVLIAQNGEMVYNHIGYVPGDEIKLENEVKKLFGISDESTQPSAGESQE